MIHVVIVSSIFTVGPFHASASLVAQLVKNLPAMQGTPGLILMSRGSPGEGNGNPLQYSYSGNPMDRGT